MRNIVALGLMVVAVVIAWHVGVRLSSDAISMAVGVFFGIMATVPAALLVVYGERRMHPIARPDSDIYRTRGVIERRVVVVVNERNEVLRREERLIGGER